MSEFGPGAERCSYCPSGCEEFSEDDVKVIERRRAQIDRGGGKIFLNDSSRKGLVTRIMRSWGETLDLDRSDIDEDLRCTENMLSGECGLYEAPLDEEIRPIEKGEIYG